MKTLKTISTIALSALVLAGCQQKELDPANSSPIKIGEKITITATGESTPTKTVLQADNSIFWSASDQITLVYGNSKGTFISQNTAPAATAEFEGTLTTVLGATENGSASGKKLYGFFPADDNITVDSDAATIAFKVDQTASAGTFDPMAFSSAAVSDNLVLRFYNILSALAITVGEDDVTEITVQNNDTSGAGIGAEAIVVDLSNPSSPFVSGQSIIRHMVSLTPDGAATFTKGQTYYMAVIPGTYTGGVTFTLRHSSGPDTVLPVNSDLTFERSKFHNVTLKQKQLTLKTLWLKQSEGTTAWNAYYGGTPGTDRNIAMDDDYVYIAENSGTAKLWAISITDPSDVKAVNVEGVTGGTHRLSCPRVIKNTDASVNGGKDVLLCSSLTRGGEDPKLYMWINGIDNAPKAITLTTWASDTWFGDVFTVYGTLQDGVLFFDKIGGNDPNGIVTFLLNGVPSGNAMYLMARLKFNDVIGYHSGACAYYPYPDNINKGVYSPGRGVEARGQNVVATGNIKGQGGITVTLTPLDYDEGTNGYVLGYNFIEWQGKRYVIYGNQSNSTTGYVRVREGSMDTDWSVIASTGSRICRRDLVVASGSLSSGNSGMDVTARVINGDLYFAAQKQNVACGLYKYCYE